MKAISPRKICFITGTRADFGIMSRLMKDLSQVEGVTLQIVATNMHLSARHGMTVDEITAEGLHVDERVEMDLSGDDRRRPSSPCRSVWGEWLMPSTGLSRIYA